MLIPLVPPYSEVVTLLESYVEWHKLDTQSDPLMVFYDQKLNKPKKNQGNQTSFNSSGLGFSKEINLEAKHPPLHHKVSMQILILPLTKMPIKMRSSFVKFATNGIILP